MNKFADWLKSRDTDLVEAVSAEDIKKHDFDALKYAQHTIQQKKAEHITAQAAKALQTIHDKIEDWVNPENHGAAHLKYLAAIVDGKNPEQAFYNYKSVSDLHRVFSQDNLMKALSDIHVLKGIEEALEKNFDRDLWPAISGKHGVSQHGEMPNKSLHGHGGMGKHYADFVVSIMKHVAEMLLKDDEPEKAPPTPAAPKAAEAPSQPLGTMASPSMA
jgi:hypothetical protein